MMIDIPDLLRALKKKRPIFHSEADFQHALAWTLHEQNSQLEIRLEHPLFSAGSAAVDVRIRDGKQLYALELKYLCRKIRVEVKGESFALKDQSAQDTRRYGVLKDIWRMERFIEKNSGARASVITLSNDPLYWKGSKEGTNDAEFSLKQGRRVCGKLNWSKNASPGAIKGNEEVIDLKGNYLMEWEDYSRVEGKYGEFRLLHIDVANSTA